MKPNKLERTTKEGFVYRTDALLKKIANIAEGGRFYFANSGIASNLQLAGFLYKINFLTARKETKDGIIRNYFEDSRYLFSSGVDFGFDWEVHPAYRWALQPSNMDDIYSTLHLTLHSD